jgi:hypothetical protein
MSFTAPGTHLQNLIIDDKATGDQKFACLKTLRIILKNLADPTKSNDPKYRSIKVSKLSAKFNPCPSATEYLKAIGFKTMQEDGEDVMRIENVDINDMQAVMVELSNALDMVTPEESAGEEKKVEYERGASSLSTTSSSTGKMSEKQKARMLMEKKERDEREEAKRARKKTQAQIKQDKFVRENDENWTSKQSAACVKSGSGISTFRDKYGE